ncbi:hypothetical protein HHI36_005061 [Cryptolaemus montrouzieri]|uniref:Uncharacterized protein n=1 Tax=Cryptolaemus montrouzieri TaxID=559131 RepID=A0ABD2NT04_9CUCU
MLRSKLRLLGRFLLRIKASEKGIHDFASVYAPNYTDSTIKSTCLLAKLDSNTNLYNISSVASTIVTLLEQKTEVPENNPYIFGIPSGMKKEIIYLWACALMTKYSEECGAVHPERLRATKLRMYIATGIPQCISIIGSSPGRE